MSDEQQGTAIQLKNKAGEMVQFDYGTYTGQGTALANQGSRIPYLSVLQALSGAVTEGNEKFIPGAKPGMFLLGDQLIEGKTGLMFIGIEEQHTLVEKTSLDGKGETIGEHDPNGPVAKKARAQFGNNKNKWRSEKGHFLVERFNMYGVVFESEEAMKTMNGKACIVGFERTKLSAREHVMTAFNKYPPGKRPPLFAAKVQLTTSFKKYKKGDFHDLVAKFAINDDFVSSLINPVTDAEFWNKWAPAAAEVAKGIKAGTIKADVSTGADDAADISEGGDIPF